MSLDGWEISNIKITGVSKGEMIKQNIPPAIKVSRTEFNNFLDKIQNWERDDWKDFALFIDEYKNVIAYSGFDGCLEINPELYKLGQEQKCYIQNEYGDDGNILFNLELEPFSLNNSETIQTKSIKMKQS